jgi:hypothetical protein
VLFLVQVRLPSPPPSPILPYDDYAVFYAAYPPPDSDDSEGQVMHAQPMHLPRSWNDNEDNNHFGFAPPDYEPGPKPSGPRSNDTGRPYVPRRCLGRRTEQLPLGPPASSP